jgi:hypothetical protein
MNISILHMTRQGFVGGLDMSVGYERDLQRCAIAALNAIEGGQYEYVADVVCDNLSQAWMLTNSIDTPWIEGDSVKHLQKPEGCRSSMIGDIFLMDGVAYVVAPHGFKKLDGFVEKISDEAATRLFG